MKSALLAAAMLFAAPALAQTTGGTGSGTPVGADAKASTATGQTSVDSTQTTTQTPMNDPAMTTQTQMPPAPATGGMETPGGYQPSQPMPMAQNGVQPVFTPAPPPSVAYPAPAPLASYPVCKKGQYDKCMQRGGR